MLMQYINVVSASREGIANRGGDPRLNIDRPISPRAHSGCLNRFLNVEIEHKMIQDHLRRCLKNAV